MAEADGNRRGRRLTRLAQLLLVLAALALWGASRLTWVVLTTFDGLGQPKTVTLSGAMWSTALVPVALLLVAAGVAALAVRGWPLRLLAVLLAVVSAATGYLAISQWVVPDVAVRAADVAQVTVASLVGSQRHYGGAVLTLAAAVATLVSAVLLMRSASADRAAARRYLAPGARPAVEPGEGDDPSERMMWDALDEGHDPTDRGSGSGAAPDTEGR